MNAAPTTVDPRLHAIAARPPDPSWSTEDLLAAAGDRLAERLAAMLGDLGVAKRHSVLANYPEVLFEGAAPRLDVRASELSARTAVECLEKSGAAPERIGLVLGVTSSPGRLLPSLVCDLFGLLPWLPRDAANLSITYMGCSAIAKAVETARWYLTCCPDRLVLVCFMDAITPLSPVLAGRYGHFDEVPPEERQRTVDALHGFLFGDAAVAMLLGAEGPGPAFGPVAHLTNERAEDAELGTVPDGGSDLPVVHGRRVYTLSPWVSARGAAYAEATVADLLRTPACGIASAAEATTLLLHTGSTRILDTLHDRLGVPPGSAATRSSYRVLRDYANTVGCSVPMMLAEPVTRPEGTALVVAFGLSFSCGAFTMTVPPGGWTP